ncbi:MAG: hypothetical protein GXN93_03235, partial [Candidatus Diapherotrites archaeon]|nr:hypothetical protein [Candidatus Diapherotrites archaeon]
MRMEALLLAFMLVVMATTVMAADPVSATTVTVENNTTYKPASTSYEQNVNAGYVYNIEVNVESVTQYWAGIMGTVNEKAVLGDSSGNKLYTWNVTKSGYVFLVAGKDPTNVAWSSLDGNVTTTDVVNDGIWSAAPSTGQTFEDTYQVATSECNAVNTALGINPTNAPDYLTLGSWTTCAYKDINNIVFAVNV